MANKFAGPKKYFVHIVAVDENYGIGFKDKLLFNIPEDLERFRKLTYGRAVLAGTKTIKTLPKLHNRKLIQFSRSTDHHNARYAEAKVNTVASARQWYTDMPSAMEPIYIIGGGEVYRETLNDVSVIALTRVFKSADKVDTYYFDPMVQEKRPLYASIGKRRKCPRTGLEFQYEIYGYDKEHLKHFLNTKHKLTSGRNKNDIDIMARSHKV